jgi:hypothetical protein
MPGTRSSGYRYFFHRGMLTVSSRKQAVCVRAWPDPVARRRLPHNPWRPHDPVFRLVTPLARRYAPERQPAGENQLALPLADERRFVETREPVSKQRAFSALRCTIPDDIAERIEPFQNHQWLPLWMAHAYRKPATDLLDSSPVLAFLLANHRRFALMMREPERRQEAARLLAGPQRQLLAYMNVPATKSMIGILRKVDLAAAGPDMLEQIAAAMRDATASRRLQHVRAVNQGVLGLVRDRRLLPLVTPRLLDEVAARRREKQVPITASRLKEIVEMTARCRRPVPLPAFRSCDQIDEVYEDLARRLPAVIPVATASAPAGPPPPPFPPPPIAGTRDIMPITTAKELTEEGDTQHHCARFLANGVQKGGLYVYKVLRPERATVAIARTASGDWQVVELRLACNRKVSEETEDAVRAWLSAATMGADAG